LAELHMIYKFHPMNPNKKQTFSKPIISIDGRRSQPYLLLTIATQMFFFIAYNKVKKIYSTLPEQFQHSIMVIGNDRTGSCKFNYHRTTTVQVKLRWKVIVLLILMEFMIITVYKLSFHINQLRCAFISVLVKGFYQTESYSLHVMQLIRISTTEEYFSFPHLVVLGRSACEILIANSIDLAICCLSRIFYFFLDRQFRS
jgi:hypothetical protein